MSVTQLTLLTSLSMMGAGIIMLPSKLAEIGMISMLSWLVSALASGAVAYIFAQCGMLSKKPGGMGGFAEYAFGRTGAFLVNYTYGVSLLIGNIAIAIASVNYGLSMLGLHFLPLSACIGTVLLLWIASVLNFPGVRFTGRITALFVWALLLPLLTLVLIGGGWFSSELYAANWNPNGLTATAAIPQSISMTFWAFLGLESACANADAVENPEKNVPRAVIYATLFTAFIYIASTNLIAGIAPNVDLIESDAPFGVVYAKLFGDGAYYVVAFLLWIGCAGSLVSWQFTMSRVFLSSARVGLFPSVFGEATQNDVAVKGFCILTTTQTVLCILITAVFSAWTAYERISDFAVFITLFAYLICMSGSFALAQQEGRTPTQKTAMDTVGLVAITAILISVYFLEPMTIKAGTIVIFFGWFFYGLQTLRMKPKDQ